MRLAASPGRYTARTMLRRHDLCLTLMRAGRPGRYKRGCVDFRFQLPSDEPYCVDVDRVDGNAAEQGRRLGRYEEGARIPGARPGPQFLLGGAVVAWCCPGQRGVFPRLDGHQNGDRYREPVHLPGSTGMGKDLRSFRGGWPALAQGPTRPAPAFGISDIPKTGRSETEYCRFAPRRVRRASRAFRDPAPEPGPGACSQNSDDTSLREMGCGSVSFQSVGHGFFVRLRHGWVSGAR